MTEYEKDGERIAQALDDAVPPDVARRLQAARRAAVDIAEQRQQRPPVLTWLPAGGAVAAGVLAVVLMQEQRMTPLPNLNDMELEAANELELLDDLAMLAWLEEQSSDAG
ncbi:MAG: hypothetical protein AAGJ86_11100 [Pseudomonadota bacterium]